MIKLVVSDLDGTLLDSKKEIPNDIHMVIKELSKRNIMFCAASGRNRESILRYFAGASIPVIAHNGIMAYSEDGELLFLSGLSREKSKIALDVAYKTSYMEPVVCGVNGIYMQKDAPEEIKEFVDFFSGHQMKMVSSLEKVFDSDQIIKVAINTGRDGSKEMDGLQLLKPYTDNFDTLLSGDGWIDIIPKDVSKGTALDRICGHYHIDMSETIIFGDYINDLDMLKRTPNSYTVANAHPDVKKACANVLPYTNDEQGVVKALKQIFGL